MKPATLFRVNDAKSQRRNFSSLRNSKNDQKGKRITRKPRWAMKDDKSDLLTPSDTSKSPSPTKSEKTMSLPHCQNQSLHPSHKHPAGQKRKSYPIWNSNKKANWKRSRRETPWPMTWQKTCVLDEREKYWGTKKWQFSKLSCNSGNNTSN